ncbi:uncharacterized protein A4U43_C06F9100 [Asparagus officinalis]|uniref:Uncharacterized protein n=1 Tax=Asparagus officinalis TaxID=4686 RepID=A0A5P1EKK6_ASPOF|nr:uncharacterized protein A4U43_C06F9100 [Asparagus officinalis]
MEVLRRQIRFINIGISIKNFVPATWQRGSKLSHPNRQPPQRFTSPHQSPPPLNLFKEPPTKVLSLVRLLLLPLLKKVRPQSSSSKSEHAKLELPNELSPPKIKMVLIFCGDLNHIWRDLASWDPSDASSAIR